MNCTTIALKKLSGLNLLERNWDSHDGLPLNNVAKQNAIEVINDLSDIEMPVPNMTICSDGSVSMEWAENGHELDFTIDGSDIIEVLLDDEELFVNKKEIRQVVDRFVINKV